MLQKQAQKIDKVIGRNIRIHRLAKKMSQTELGIAMAERIENDIREEVTVEQRARLEGRQMTMMVSPRKK